MQHGMVIEIIDEQVMERAFAADAVERHQGAAVIGSGEPREEGCHRLLRVRGANQRRRQLAEFVPPQAEGAARQTVVPGAALKRKNAAQQRLCRPRARRFE